MINFGCCCGDCDIATDDFNRADGDSLGASWSEESGDADIASNQLSWQTTGIAIHQTTHPGGATAPARVRVKFKRSSTTEYARVILGWQDSSNYLYASVETVSSCDVLRLFKVVSGTTTEVQTAQTIGDGAPVDVLHTLEACLEPANYPTSGDIFRAKVTLDGGKVYGSQAESGDYVGGTKAGVAASAGVVMDDFYFGWMKEEGDPDHDTCPDCTTGCLIETDASETTCKWDSGKLRVFHPELGTKHYATATFDLADGENATVKVNMTSDGSAYHWGKLALSGTTLTLTLGKTGTTLGTTTGTGSAGTQSLTVCFDGHALTAIAGSLSLVKPSTAVANGIYAGRSGTADFTYFEFQKHRNLDDSTDLNCPNCEETFECTVCDNDTAHTEWLVMISGVANGDCPGITNAGVVNTAFIVRNMMTDVPALGACSHTDCGGDPPCCWSSGCISGDSTYQVGSLTAPPNGCCAAQGWIRLHTVSMRLKGSATPGWVRVELHLNFVTESVTDSINIVFVVELPSINCLDTGQAVTLTDVGGDERFCTPPQDSIFNVSNAAASIRPL